MAALRRDIWRPKRYLASKAKILKLRLPFGMVGALAALWIMGAPFGFMAFLGVVSLVGVIVSHIIVRLFPLASHGGPLWEPMCYAQIGGLSVATFITLLLVPVLYAIFVLDLKLVKWEKDQSTDYTDYRERVSA